MAKLIDPQVNQRVVVSRPRSFQGHRGSYPAPATIVYVNPSGRNVDVVFDGELDEILFWVDELDLIE